MSKKIAALFFTLFLVAGFAVYAEETIYTETLPETPLVNYLPSENDKRRFMRNRSTIICIRNLGHWQKKSLFLRIT